MAEVTYMVGGRALTALEAQRELAMKHPPKLRAKAQQDAKYHKGWAVEGYPPGFIAECERIAVEELARWEAQAESTKAARLRSGDKPPKPWDLTRWLATHKRKRVRPAPYSTPAAADECAELARKAGWEHVQVTAQSKGEAPPQGEFA